MNASCTGKRRYPSFALADKGAKRARHKDKNVGAYHCEACSGWHTGTKHAKDTPKYLKLQRARLAQRLDPDE